MKKRLLFILSILPIIVSAQNPGGVAGANLWLKADAGSSPASGTLTGWTDQVGTNSFSVSGDPQTGTNLINYNNVIDFDGTGDYLTGDAAITFQTLYAVIKRDNADFTSTVLSASNGTQNEGYILKGDQLATGNNQGAANQLFFQSTGTLGVGSTRLAIAEIVPALDATNSLTFIDGQSFSTSFLAGAGPVMQTFTEIPYVGRSQDPANADEFDGQIAELIMFGASHVAGDRNRVQSYLAIKYGITLDPGVTNYITSTSAGIWDATDATYHNDVIGIARDDNSGLLQRQSTTNDDSTQIYLSTLAADNTSNAGTFSSDAQFVIIGHNNEALQSLGSLEYPAGQLIYKRLEREWKITNTGFNGTFSMDIQLSANDTNFPADLVLLVDADGDFSDATLASPFFTIADGNVSITGITTTEIPTNSTRYITIASVSKNSALPVNLVRFEVKNLQNEEVAINWITASETSNKQFTIEKSENTKDWKAIKSIEGNGNSESVNNYSHLDLAPYNGMNYYRLKQEDLDGSINYSSVKSININKDYNFDIYPNPAQSKVRLSANVRIKDFRIFDIMGRDVSSYVEILELEENDIELDISNLVNGIYFLNTGAKRKTFIKNDTNTN